MARDHRRRERQRPGRSPRGQAPRQESDCDFVRTYAIRCGLQKAVIHQIHFSAAPLHGVGEVPVWQTAEKNCKVGRFLWPAMKNSEGCRELLFWFFRGLLLTLKIFRPRRNDSVDARIGDGLAEVFAEMTDDENHSAAIGAVLAKQF